MQTWNRLITDTWYNADWYDSLLTASNSQTGWIVAHNLKNFSAAACNSKTAKVAFHRHTAWWLHFRIAYLLK